MSQSSTRHPRGPPIGLRCITSTASPGQCSHRARALTLTSVTRSHTPPAVQKWDCWSDCQPSLTSLALSMPSIFSPSSHGHSQCPSDSPPSGCPSLIGRLDTSGYRTGPLALSLKKRTSQIDGWLVAKDATDSAVASTEGLGSASSLAELKAAIKTVAPPPLLPQPPQQPHAAERVSRAGEPCERDF